MPKILLNALALWDSLEEQTTKRQDESYNNIESTDCVWNKFYTWKKLLISFFRYHPHFKNVMQSRISQLMGINYKFDLLLSEDGSGRGAALVAAVLKR